MQNMNCRFSLYVLFALIIAGCSLERKEQYSIEQETAEVQLELGMKYLAGQEVAQDYEKALEWFKKSAAQKNLMAQYNIGVMYANGYGVAQDYL
jgi:TPR repeat protein